MEAKVFTREELVTRYPEAQTLSDLIRQIEKEASSNGYVLCQIKVNGMVLTESDENQFSDASVEEINELGVDISRISELVIDTIASTGRFAKQLSEKSIELADLFRKRDLKVAHESLIKFTDAISSLLQAWQLVRDVGLPSSMQQSAKIIEIDNEITSVMTEVLNSYQKQDFVLTADILEYDVATALDHLVSLVGVAIGDKKTQEIEI